jgi:small subunit ribosomal protein S16
VVVADARAARDGRFIEIIGHYNPLTSPATIHIDVARASEWIKKGAQPSNTVRVLLQRAGTASAAGTDSAASGAGTPRA